MTTWAVAYNMDFAVVETLKESDLYNAWAGLTKHFSSEVRAIDLPAIDHAAYVITISAPFTIDYGADHHPVIYVGKGHAHTRFKQHIGQKLLPLLETLKGARFDFWVLDCGSGAVARAVESRLLGEFRSRYRHWPLLNARDESVDVSVPVPPSCYEPLDRRRIGKRHWRIRRIES